MTVVPLSKDQVAEIYQAHLCQDFPPDEQKTLDIILKAMDAGKYECYALTEDELLGYAFFVKLEQDYLLDYLAIVRGKRDLGLGSVFLKELALQMKSAKSMIVEVEEPASGKNEAERTLRSRRKAFYLRNGFYDTGVNAEAFGVNFRLLEPSEKPRSQEDIKELYLRHYGALLPPRIFEAQIKCPCAFQSRPNT